MDYWDLNWNVDSVSKGLYEGRSGFSWTTGRGVELRRTLCRVRPRLKVWRRGNRYSDTFGTGRLGVKGVNICLSNLSRREEPDETHLFLCYGHFTTHVTVHEGSRVSTIDNTNKIRLTTVLYERRRSLSGKTLCHGFVCPPPVFFISTDHGVPSLILPATLRYRTSQDVRPRPFLVFQIDFRCKSEHLG